MNPDFSATRWGTEWGLQSQTNTAGSTHMAGGATKSTMLHGEIVSFRSQRGLVVHGTTKLWRNDVEVKNFENTEYEEKHYYVARYESAVEVGYYEFQAREPGAR